MSEGGGVKHISDAIGKMSLSSLKLFFPINGSQAGERTPEMYWLCLFETLYNLPVDISKVSKNCGKAYLSSEAGVGGQRARQEWNGCLQIEGQVFDLQISAVCI